MRFRPIVLLLLALASLPLARAATPSGTGKAAQVRTRAAALLNDGVAAYGRGEYAKAVEALRESASMALNSFRAHYYLGLALGADRRYAESIDVLEIALDLSPDDLNALVALGNAQLKLGDIDEARAAYFRAMKLRPAFAPALDGLARVYEAQARLSRAIEYYRRSIASNKGYAPAYTHLGDLFLGQDRLDEAVALLEEAVSIRPDYGPGMNRLALAYGRLGLDNEAVATVQKAIELDPHNPSHPSTLGVLQLGQGFVAAAERSFARALELDPGLPEARKGMAEVFRRRGDYELALAEIDDALQDPRVPADMVLELRDYRDEVEHERVRVAELETRAESGEATPEERGELARIYAGRALWDRAVEQQRLAGSSADQREILAYLLFRAGRYRESNGIYDGLAAETGDPSQRVNAGVTLALLGDDPGAVEAYRSVLEDQPDHRTASLYLGNALLRLERRQAAALAYRSFLDTGSEGEAAERVRRILKRIAPELLPKPSSAPPPPSGQESPSGTGVTDETEAES